MKIRYSEKFYSLQGEGYHVGVPSVFLRTFGCNFRCKHFGRDKNETIGKHNPEVIPIIENLDAYKTFEDLPIIETGCDTYASIYPEFKRFMKDEDVSDLANGLTALTPFNSWSVVTPTKDDATDIHLILTGGEPMLGWQKQWPELLDNLADRGLRNVTIETNGTQKLSKEFRYWLTHPHRDIRVTWSCSPKLSASGHTIDEAVKPETIKEYIDASDFDHDIFYFKFVVSTVDEIEEVGDVIEMYQDAGVNEMVYLMPVGGRKEEYERNMTLVAKEALARGYRFSPRLHTTLFGNEWGT